MWSEVETFSSWTKYPLYCWMSFSWFWLPSSASNVTRWLPTFKSKTVALYDTPTPMVNILCLGGKNLPNLEHPMTE